MPVSPPSILWIVTTQWRAQATGLAGDPNARTPHLDALAAHAVVYAQAVTPHPFGPFARAALLTGVPSPENGVCDYHDPLPRSARTIAHRLAARGYDTAFFGKWHLYRRDPAAPPVGEGHAKIVVPPEWRGGFACWEGFEGGFLLNDPWLHGTRLPEPVQFSGYQADVICERAADWIIDTGCRMPEAGGRRPDPEERNDGKMAAFRFPVSAIAKQNRPWFCVVSLEPPHPPYAAPAGGVAARDPREIVLAGNVPRGGEVEAKARRELAGYYAHLEATDRAIGRLLARLPSGNAVVVVTSVHGDMHGAHGLFRKGWPHEESIRVPLLVRGAHPDGTGFWVLGSGPGESRSELVSLLELPRWAEEWADAAQGRSRHSEPPTELQRISMPSVVRLPLQCDRTWRGARTLTRKLVVNEDGSPWLFFDLERDPGEERNLAGNVESSAEIAKLRQRL
ncbi:MAG TPA: sulfatase-like hydrolase/transferase [Opitutaceae bacterium]|nr:sulfatase-like hydrolase/transferase [Opitutaceae bacterium]